MEKNISKKFGDRTECRKTKCRGQNVADKMSHGQNVAGQNVARQNVADISLRTKCCGQIVVDKMLHGQIVARTKCCIDKMLQGQNVAKKTSHGQMVARTKCCVDKTLQKKTSHEQIVSQNKMLYGQNGAWIFRWKLRAGCGCGCGWGVGRMAVFFSLRVLPFFWLFLVLEDGITDPPEIFTTSRAPKISLYVFEEKNFKKGFYSFCGKTLTFHRSASGHITTPLKFHPIELKIFFEIPQTISQRCFWAFSKISLSFFFWEKSGKIRIQNPDLDVHSPIKPDKKVQNGNGWFHLWRMLPGIYGKSFSSIGWNLRGS